METLCTCIISIFQRGLDFHIIMQNNGSRGVRGFFYNVLDYLQNPVHAKRGIPEGVPLHELQRFD